MEENLELRKVRDFGELINDSFVFLKQNWKPMFRAVALICGGLIFVSIVTGVIQQLRITSNFSTAEIRQNPFSIYSWDTVVYWIVMTLTYFSVSLASLSYICLYHDKGKVAPVPEEVWSYFKYFFFRVAGVQLMLSVLLIMGLVLCVFPGVYFWPVSALIMAVMVFENGGYGYSFRKGFSLIRGNWWSTFGAMFIMGVVIVVAAIALTLPVSIFAGMGVLLGDMKASAPVLVASMILNQLTQLLYIPIYVVIALAYFSLVEKKEGVGLRERIESIGKNDTDAGLPEEQY